VFPITFNTGQALPLVVTRILRPRMSREVDAQQSRIRGSQRPRQGPVRDPELATGRAHSRKGRKRGQAADADRPYPQSRQQIVRVRELAPGQSSHDQATVTDVIYSCSVQDDKMSASTDTPQPRASRKSSANGTLAVHRLSVSIAPPTEFPVRIQHAPTYDLI
jgi:hypothetical protein